MVLDTTNPGAPALGERIRLSKRQLVLAVCLRTDTEGKLAPVLGRDEFELKAVHSFEEALKLLERVRFDAVLIGSETPEEELQDLLVALRRPGVPSSGASVVLFLPPEDTPLTRAYLSAGASEVLPTSIGSADAQAIVLRVLRAKVRVELRVMARLTIRLGGAASQILCQTRDLSRNGMFVITETRFPIGSPIQFTLHLSGTGDSLLGEAQVVRHVSGSGDRPDGLGLRFVSFAADGCSRLAAYLDQQRV